MSAASKNAASVSSIRGASDRRDPAAADGACSSLRARGFEYEEANGSLFLPIRISQDELARAVADESPGQASHPFTDALQVCADAKPDFDALLKASGGPGGVRMLPI